MSYNIVDLKNDFSKVLKSSIGCSQPNKSYEILQLSNFFSDEIYKDSVVCGHAG